MTREEALVQLRLGPGINEDVSEEYNEAVNMAVEALQQQPSEDEKIIRIRKGTLKARTGRYVVYDVEWLKTHFNTTEAKIYGQPKERTEERTETHECDCISRQLMYDMGATCIATRNKDGDLVALGALDILPSATPQPKEESQQKVGHWIGHREHCERLGVMPSGLGAYEWCSNCDYGIDIRDWSRISHNYCPKCGTKMQEAQK